MLTCVHIVWLLSVLASLVSANVAFASRKSFYSVRRSSSSSARAMGLLDDLKLIFSEEGKKNRADYDARQRAEAEEALAQVMERRRNPEEMRKYDDQRAQERRKLAEDKELWAFQQKNEKGYDPLLDWNKLREEGKIKVGSDLERDESSRRLGSEGLIDVRIDELLPYIDQGYVDEDADVMGNIMKLFGGGRKKKDNL